MRDENRAATQKCAALASTLTVVDIQERLGEAMPGKVLNRVLQNTCLLVRAAEILDVPVIRTEQYPKGLGKTHSQIESVLPTTTENFEKTTFSCADVEGYSNHLKDSDRGQVILSGMEAHICVLQTALDLDAEGYQVFVAEDAICSRRLENYQNALDRLRQCEINVVSSESIVFEWLGNATHPGFKTIQSLLR
ncbi:MAG: isochorismatase family protein [Pseudomonadota bacterium]